MLDDATFMAFMRQERNPGAEIPDAAYSDTDDMAGNLLILYALARGMNAQNILEIGVHDGTSTLAFLKALSETGGKLDSVDIAPCETAVRLVEHYGLSAHWEFWQINSQSAFFRMNHYDIVFIDGDHTWGGSQKDVDRFAPCIRRGGFLLFHDCRFGPSAGEPGSLLTAHCLMTYGKWRGVMLPFSCQLGIFRRVEENSLTLKEMNT